MKQAAIKEWHYYVGFFTFGVVPIALLLFSLDWQIRFFAVLVLFFSFQIWLIWCAFGPIKNLGDEGKTIWPKYVIKYFGDNVYLGTRILIFLCASVMFILFTVPLSKDVVAVLKSDGPVVKLGKITDISGGISSSQTIRFNNEINSSENDYHALFFPLGFFRYGNTYQVVYLPHSHYILEAVEVK